MKEVKKYTQKEIKSNINTLTHQLDMKKLQRTELTQSINSTKKTNSLLAGIRHFSN